MRHIKPNGMRPIALYAITMRPMMMSRPAQVDSNIAPPGFQLRGERRLAMYFDPQGLWDPTLPRRTQAPGHGRRILKPGRRGSRPANAIDDSQPTEPSLVRRPRHRHGTRATGLRRVVLGRCRGARPRRPFPCRPSVQVAISRRREGGWRASRLHPEIPADLLHGTLRKPDHPSSNSAIRGE